jgi:predicted DNA-binding protein with PD1-like motif
LAHDADLLTSIREFADREGIGSGMFHLIGAVKKATLSFYDQQVKKYVNISLNRPLEVLSCVGNVGKLDGKTVIHAHVTLSDGEGKAYGGHLSEGTTIFSAELFLIELKGVSLEREYDTVTGLNLFKFD